MHHPIHLLVAALCAAAPAAAAERYVARDLGSLGTGYAQAKDVNAAGQVVGSSHASRADGTLRQHAFLWQDGVMRDLGLLPGCTTAVAEHVNAHGDVVGWAQTETGAMRAWLWRAGTLVELPFDRVGGIADDGRVVGAVAVAAGSWHIRVWRDGAVLDYGDVGGAGPGALQINDRGAISGTRGLPLTSFLRSGGPAAAAHRVGDIGSVFTGDVVFAYGLNQADWVTGTAALGGPTPPIPSWQAFLWKDGRMFPLGVGERGLMATGHDVNASLAVVGHQVSRDAGGQAVLWQDGASLRLATAIDAAASDPVDGLAIAWAINDAGAIVAEGPLTWTFADGVFRLKRRSYLLTPVPDEAAAAGVAAR